MSGSRRPSTELPQLIEYDLVELIARIEALRPDKTVGGAI
jgi:hypothetical protein